MTHHEPTTGAAADAVELLESDHRVVEQLFRQLDGATESDVQRTIGEKIVAELSVHATVEEQLAYPAARDALPDGDRLVDEALHEHAELKRVLAALDGRRPTDDGYHEGFAEARRLVEHHVAEEEGDLFPRLRQALGPERLMEMGRMLEEAKQMAPTRPHPHAPDTPPGNIVAGAVVGVVDQARDAMRDALREAGG